jgi:hypothetical protein
MSFAIIAPEEEPIELVSGAAIMPLVSGGLVMVELEPDMLFEPVIA